MMEVKVISAAEESALLAEWFETVHFDKESEGIPELQPEDDDEESRNRADARSIEDWFDKPYGTPIPVSDFGDYLVSENFEAWQFVDLSNVPMHPDAAKEYIMGEARFQLLYSEERGNPNHSKKNGQFVKGGGGSASPKVSESGSLASTEPIKWGSAEKEGNSTVWKSGQHSVTNFPNSQFPDAEVEKVILPAISKLHSTNPVDGPIDVRLVHSLRYNGTSASGLTVIGKGQIKLSGSTVADRESGPRDPQKAPARARKPHLSETILVHEWGHSIDRRDPATAEMMPTVSGYGRTSPLEAYAENFAEFYLSNGKTQEKAALDAAKEFGWSV